MLAYSDTVVADLIERYGIDSESLLLDPFCGTGTTLVAAKMRDIPSIGADANPVAAFASTVKTSWGVDVQELEETLAFLRERFREFLGNAASPALSANDAVQNLRRHLSGSLVEPRLKYFASSGMLEREWMHELPMLQSFALLNLIENMETQGDLTDLLRLVLVSTVLGDISNVAYGPEIFVKKSKKEAKKDVWAAFERRSRWALEDLKDAPKVSATSKAVEMDSRDLTGAAKIGSVSHVITSPPYPTEKDYTRNSRLELVFLGYVSDVATLQGVKKTMIRSHSKGIYKQDNDGEFVEGIESVHRVERELAAKASTKTYGFAKLYPKIITEYFGGMRRHFRTLKPLMAAGGIAAYVVGEQATYLQTYTPTAAILGELAQLEGFEIKEILPFRVRIGSTGGGRQIKEEILVLQA